jgi:hypothetical protein
VSGLHARHDERQYDGGNREARPDDLEAGCARQDAQRRGQE